MNELKHFTCVMTAEITRVVEARNKEHALELVDENDMMYELKNYKTDYEMSAKELGGRSKMNYQDKMLVVYHMLSCLVNDKPVRVTEDQYELFKAVYDSMDTGVRLDVKELDDGEKFIVSLGRYK